MQPPSVLLEDVGKSFGLIEALRGVSLSIGRGERVLLTGPNGAGKTTLLRVISCQTSPTKGRIEIEGRDPKKDREGAKRSVGLVGHRSFLYDELTVGENLRFYGDFYGATGDDLDSVLEVANLTRLVSSRAGHLSFGLRKRADIARALLCRPSVLALDELFSGLDSDSSARVLGSLKGFEGTIVLSSHTREYAEELCGREVALREGRVERDAAI